MTSGRPTPVDPAAAGAVAAGGVAGSLGRWAVGLALPHAPGTFPWATFLVNVSGALAMGLLVAFLVGRPGTHRLARPFVGVGVLGGWTTFSALAVEAVGLAGGHDVQTALGYVAATFLVGTLAVGAGTVLGRRLWGDG
jgi:CrcB protein